MAGSEKPFGFSTWETSGGNFGIEDPLGLRDIVQPIVSFPLDREDIVGMGTCFQVSPWCWLTAHHVVTQGSESCFSDQNVGAIGFSPGVVFGTVGFRSNDLFGEIRQVNSYSVASEGSNAAIPGPKPLDIVLDVASLRVNVDNLNLGRRRLISPLPIALKTPAIDERVLAIGYPILGTKFDERSARHIFEDFLTGAPAKVVATHPHGTSQMKPWPTFEVEGDWPSGMSGGPVVNMSGQVVGIVSSSFAPTDTEPGVGYAVDLANVELRQIAPELDRRNPGWVFGGALIKDDELIGFYANEEVAHLARMQRGEGEVVRVTCNPKTMDWIEFR